jgi:GTPase SAR1 family protein
LYEAKVLLVGEGNVGKTSLIAALRNDPFVEGRPTTHGIEIQSMGQGFAKVGVTVSD